MGKEQTGLLWPFRAASAAMPALMSSLEMFSAPVESYIQGALGIYFQLLFIYSPIYSTPKIYSAK